MFETIQIVKLNEPINYLFFKIVAMVSQLPRMGKNAPVNATFRGVEEDVIVSKC